MSLKLINSFINNKYDKALVLKDSCKTFDEKKKRIYSVTYFFKFLLILNIVYPILSNYSISVETIELKWFWLDIGISNFISEGWLVFIFHKIIYHYNADKVNNQQDIIYPLTKIQILNKKKVF